ncbi:MAG: phage virion morphogenesis protein [Gammaproteobacteria bacterium]|nr:phage virion morphogenesis protein [Gammaproteobacteria bacterium]MBU1505787.1 phage virion morphogenesis protein [Gammaproteobacteria bacterium]MBU2119475.1 phage virion morphogenesis protein [Gammaproteobacteria bacterium]MBU2172619.1 phage virion morphogenesis protein [Gammaproteobacteria bacterium]MBU2202077.1 phage virion morphogenesis protein [Gammaproteobacteria bacterium]
MAGTHVTYIVEDQAVRDMLARQALPPDAELASQLGEYLQSSTEARFKTQTAPDGTPWAPLKPRYAKRKKYHKDKVLTLRGYLRGGIHFQVGADNSVQVGTNAKYGAIHQFGGAIEMPARQATVRYRSEAGRVLFASKKHQGAMERQVTIPAHEVNMPARPFLGISAEDDREIRSIVLAWIDSKKTE